MGTGLAIKELPGRKRSKAIGSLLDSDGDKKKGSSSEKETAFSGQGENR